MKTPHYLRKYIIATSLTFCTTGVITIVNAEQIKIPIGQQTTQDTVKMPVKGMTKERVQTVFGEPMETTAAKGQPPISSWKYKDFVVYFENNHVIHSVTVFKPQQEQIITTD